MGDQPFSVITNRSYLSCPCIGMSGLDYPLRILDIYMLGCSNIILEPEQEDICSIM